MRRVIILFCFSVFSTLLKAAEKFPVGSIPKELLKNANLVTRLEVSEFQVNSLRSSSYKLHYALTILNENGDNYADFVVGYDKDSKINSLEGKLYDAQGNLLRKVKAKDFIDQSAISDISLHEDNRVKFYDFHYRTYPYTVEFEYTISYSNTFHFPGWFPQGYRKQSVEQSSYTVTVPNDYTLRYKMFNYPGKPAIVNAKNEIQYTWEVKQLAAIEPPFAAPRWHELTPMVSLAPSNFEFGDYKGNMSSWKDLGQFIYTLNKGRDQVPPELKMKVEAIIANAKTEKEKVEALYQFMQKNTRYVSIQLGIGGFQPFPASYVFEKGYGDCKALSNYMYSLLKLAGINSKYALIKAGDFDYYLSEDLPHPQFNHAILCVPLSKDTVWLECTSQTSPAGYMGSFTGNRKALLIDENGGELVTTPRYGINENTQVRKINAKLDQEGNLNFISNTVYRCMQQDDKSKMIEHLSNDKVKQELQENLHLSTYDVNSFKYTQKKSELPEVEEVLDITARNYATVTGKRLFIVPNILTQGGRQITEKENRIYDFVFHYAYRDEDFTEIDIPEGYQIEASPKDVSIKTKYGNYSCAVSLKGNKIIYKRTMEQFAGRFPASEQAGIIQFYYDIFRADRAKLVLVKRD